MRFTACIFIAVYSRKLRADIRRHVSGDYGEFLARLLVAERDQSYDVDHYEAIQDAYKIDRVSSQRASVRVQAHNGSRVSFQD